MDIATVRRRRLIAIVAINTVYWGLLVWQHLHGGVPGHSFLARDDMPRISNWWGALLLPVLTVWLTGRMQARVERHAATGATVAAASRTVMIAFAAALLYALALAASFATGRSDLSSMLFRALPVVALLWPVYRAEYALGFILGLTYTFGAMLPTLIATVVVVMSIVLHQTVRRGFNWLVARQQRRVGESRAK